MSKQKDATPFTADANRAKYSDPDLHWEDKLDFESAQRGFIAQLEDPVIRNEEGLPVWDLTPYTFLDRKLLRIPFIPAFGGRPGSTCITACSK